MKKILLIARREFFAKTARRQFWILTVAGPFLMLSLLLVPALTGTRSAKSPIKTLLIDDASGSWETCIAEKAGDFYEVSSFKNAGPQTDVPALMLTLGAESENPKATLFISPPATGSDRALIQMILDQCMLGCSDSTGTPVSLTAVNTPAPDAAEDYQTVTSMYAAILIYFFIFLYSLQTMRAVIEDKTGRIAEILITSVSPAKLMAGKIAGTGAVSLLQFFIWTGTFAGGSAWLYSRFRLSSFNDANIEHTLQQVTDVRQAMEVHEIISAIEKLPWLLLVVVFVYCFLAGYWIYAALAAAIGATGDSETDTQQYLLPLTAPLLTAFMFLPAVLEQPHGALARLLSCIPLTAPVILPARLVFMPSGADIALSCLCMAAGAVGTTVLAGKIFKNVLLRYGKKVSLREWL